MKAFINKIINALKNYTKLCVEWTKSSFSKVKESESTYEFVWWSILFLMVLAFVWFSWKIVNAIGWSVISILAIIGLGFIYHRTAKIWEEEAPESYKRVKMETIKKADSVISKVKTQTT